MSFQAQHFPANLKVTTKFCCEEIENGGFNCGKSGDDKIFHNFFIIIMIWQNIISKKKTDGSIYK